MFTGIYLVERKLIELFEADNPNFNKAKFKVTAEGGPQNVLTGYNSKGQERVEDIHE